MDEDEKKIFVRQERRQWIEGLRYKRKLIRKLIRLQDKIRAGNIYQEVLCYWRNTRRIKKGEHVK